MEALTQDVVVHNVTWVMCKSVLDRCKVRGHPLVTRVYQKCSLSKGDNSRAI